MFINFMLDVFREVEQSDAIVYQNRVYSYGWLYEAEQQWEKAIAGYSIPRGSVVVLEADFSPNAIALFLALLQHGSILVPLTKSVAAKRDEFIEIAQGEYLFRLDEATDEFTFSKLQYDATHSIYTGLRGQGHPGLVLFSSGSTGKSKAAVHDFTGILEKFKVRRFARRAVTFLLYDHIGGVNTMLYTLSNGGCIVTVQDRSPDSVLEAVARFKVDTLPTSPTFINLILISESYKRHDLSSLKLITYGTEPMPESTLKRFHQLLPHIELLQTYGLSEVGILRSKSKSSDSLWVKVGGEGFETRVVEGILQIKAKSAMQGYLNAPSPFTEDGWFITGDQVEVDGEYLKILGRKSELINVGGEKVYPQEVENTILELPEVAEVTVYSEKNPITGNIVCAKVRPKNEIEHKALIDLVRKHCREHLQPFKVPVKIKVTTETQFSERFKKMRSAN